MCTGLDTGHHNGNKTKTGLRREIVKNTELKREDDNDKRAANAIRSCGEYDDVCGHSDSDCRAMCEMR